MSRTGTTSGMREERGKEIANECHIVQLDRGTFLVPSQANPERQYKVENISTSWICECPDYVYRAKLIGECRHIHAVKFWTAFKAKVEESVEPSVPEIPPISCPICQSQNIIRHGTRKTIVGPRQRLMCAQCGKTFIEDQAFKKIIATPKIVALALDLYWKGVSFRKIKDTAFQFEGLKISHVTVYNWVQRYMSLVTSYVDQLKPEVSGIWHADEAMLKVKQDGFANRTHGDSKWVWLWNVLDHNTRFLICNQITKTRETEDARRIFLKAKAQAGIPDVVVTDGLHAYEKGINKALWTLSPSTRPKHVRLTSIRAKVNNNSIERFHGTMRERDKVLRALENPKTAETFQDHYRTYYNFIRPNQAINGKTPAEEAGLNLRLEQNKWLTLIQQAINRVKQPQLTTE